MTSPDPQPSDKPFDHRLWLLPAGLALLLLAAAVAVFGPRLLGRVEGAPLTSIPPFEGTPDGGVTSGLEELPAPGQAAPDFALPDLDGATVRLSDFSGRPVVLNFWATCCAHCRLEMPALARAMVDYAERDLMVLAINQDETAVPVGEDPPANAVLLTAPASTSACVRVYAAAVQVIDAPAVRLVAGQVTVPILTSLTPTAASVTLPVLVTMNVYVMVSPAAATPSSTPVLTSAIDGSAGSGVVNVSSSVTGSPVGGVPVADAVFSTSPASTSACVSV